MKSFIIWESIARLGSRYMELPLPETNPLNRPSTHILTSLSTQKALPKAYLSYLITLTLHINHFAQIPDDLVHHYYKVHNKEANLAHSTTSHEPHEPASHTKSYSFSCIWRTHPIKPHITCLEIRFPSNILFLVYTFFFWQQPLQLVSRSGRAALSLFSFGVSFFLIGDS
jgi:hypothetical protein